MSLNLRSTFIASQAKDDKIIVDCCLVRGFVFFVGWLVGVFLHKVEREAT